MTKDETKVEVAIYATVALGVVQAAALANAARKFASRKLTEALARRSH